MDTAVVVLPALPLMLGSLSPLVSSAPASGVSEDVPLPLPRLDASPPVPLVSLPLLIGYVMSQVRKRMFAIGCNDSNLPH